MNHGQVRILVLKRQAVVPACLGLAILLMLAGAAAAQVMSSRHSVSGSEHLKAETLDRVSRSGVISIEFTNFEAVPVTIRNAAVREIDNAGFQALTGKNSNSQAYTTFPEVTVTNPTGKKVIGLVLMVGNRRTQSVHGVNFSRVAIDPGANFVVRPTDWVRAERSVQIADDGKVTKQTKPRLDSDRMWWPGTAHEMVLRVGMVVFEDGTKWTTSSDLDPW